MGQACCRPDRGFDDAGKAKLRQATDRCYPMRAEIAKSRLDDKKAKDRLHKMAYTAASMGGYPQTGVCMCVRACVCVSECARACVCVPHEPHGPRPSLSLPRPSPDLRGVNRDLPEDFVERATAMSEDEFYLDIVRHAKRHEQAGGRLPDYPASADGLPDFGISIPLVVRLETFIDHLRPSTTTPAEISVDTPLD